MSQAALRTVEEGGVARAPRHFLDIRDHDSATLRAMIDHAARMKRGVDTAKPLAGKTVALIFEKPSTRTRVSFEVGIRQLGGDVVMLAGSATQLDRGETVADTARVLSRYVDAVMYRTDNPAKLHEMAANATIPVINGLTAESHPCQLMADVMTFEEHKGPIAGQVIAWVGDGNNVARSWIESAARFGFTLRLATPPELIELGRSCRASKLQELTRIRLPFAVPFVFGGLKVAAALAVVGAVVAEFVGADAGLGYLIQTSMAFFKTPLAFGAVVILAAMGIVLFQAVTLIEKLLFPWSSGADQPPPGM